MLQRLTSTLTPIKESASAWFQGRGAAEASGDGGQGDSTPSLLVQLAGLEVPAARSLSVRTRKKTYESTSGSHVQLGYLHAAPQRAAAAAAWHAADADTRLVVSVLLQHWHGCDPDAAHALLNAGAWRTACETAGNDLLRGARCVPACCARSAAVEESLVCRCKHLLLHLELLLLLLLL